jgi:hypothetical protein
VLTPPAPIAAELQWAPHQFVFTANSPLTRLSFQDLSGFDDNTSFVDTVSVQPVPETVPGFLFGLAVLLIEVVRRYTKLSSR